MYGNFKVKKKNVAALKWAQTATTRIAESRFANQKTFFISITKTIQFF